MQVNISGQHVEVTQPLRDYVLEKLARVESHFDKITNVQVKMCVEKLIAREKLGSTGFGNGIAIPHCRLEGCSSPVSALLHLDAPIDYDAIDGAPVDLLFVLLVPEAATDAHLELLRQIASMLDRKEVRERLRAAHSSEALFQVVLDAQNEH